jgi:HK97 family phage major capsid protein
MNRFKKLMEKRAAYQTELQGLLDTAESEERALNAEETARFEELEGLIQGIDGTIQAEERARSLVHKESAGGKENEEERRAEEREAQEERAFADYIRGIVSEERADVNMTTGDNGAVIPSSIANKIIEKVVDICPVYELADRYNTKGTLLIPYYDEKTSAIEMGYSTEFSKLNSTSGTFKSIELKGFLAGALSKVSKSLVNNSQFNITNYVVTKMAESIARWIEKELLNGTPDKIDGISKAEQVVTAEASTAVTGDELIDLQETVPDIYQPGCIWIMNKATRTAIRKLKDKDGNYILNKDATSRWGYTLFGNDVFCSDNLAKMEAGKTAIIYGDMSGLAVKVSEDMNIEVLREKYAEEHAIGVVGWMELDAKIENQQKIAVLKMKAAA